MKTCKCSFIDTRRKTINFSLLPQDHIPAGLYGRLRLVLSVTSTCLHLLSRVCFFILELSQLVHVQIYEVTSVNFHIFNSIGAVVRHCISQTVWWKAKGFRGTPGKTCVMTDILCPNIFIQQNLFALLVFRSSYTYITWPPYLSSSSSFLFRSARSIGLRQCLAIRGSFFSFLDPLAIW
jgi:hypothetical protein